MIKQAINKYIERHGFGAFHPKAVLFDMDGVLYNSMPNHAYSWHKAMKKCGIEMTEAEAYQYEGMRGVETIKLLAERQWGRKITDPESQAMYEEKCKVFATCPKAEIMPSVKALQQLIAQGGRKIVVVTGSGQHSLLEKLTHDFNGLILPGMIVSSADVSHGKPHPEPYLKGLDKAGVKAGEAVVVENAPLGVRAAVAAGIFTIAVNTGPLPDSMLAAEGADIVFKSMDELKEAWPDIAGD